MAGLFFSLLSATQGGSRERLRVLQQVLAFQEVVFFPTLMSPTTGVNTVLEKYSRACVVMQNK